MLRKYDYSETSQILRLLTRRSGVVSVLAKGTKKEKSSFGGALDLFYLGQALILFRPRSALNILSTFTVEDAFSDLRSELPRFYAACHLAEILTGMTREEEPHPGLFDLMTTGLRLLETARESDVPPLLAALELSALRDLGFAPSLSTCTECGRHAESRGTSLSASLGGALCEDCRGQDPEARSVSPGVLSALRALASAPPEKARRVRLTSRDARAIRGFLTAFVEWRLERQLRTARFL